MTPKEKAEELYYILYSKIEYAISEEYLPHRKDIVKQCALLAVEEVIQEANCADGVYDGRKYWSLVKQELENL